MAVGPRLSGHRFLTGVEKLGILNLDGGNHELLRTRELQRQKPSGKM